MGFGHMYYYICDFTIERQDNAGALRLLTNQRNYQYAQAKVFGTEKNE